MEADTQSYIQPYAVEMATCIIVVAALSFWLGFRRGCGQLRVGLPRSTKAIYETVVAEQVDPSKCLVILSRDGNHFSAHLLLKAPPKRFRLGRTEDLVFVPASEEKVPEARVRAV